MKEQSSYQRNKETRPIVIALAVYLILAAAILRLVPKHFIFNRSESMPIGIYRITGKIPERDSIVGACIPEPYASFVRVRGYIDSGPCTGRIRPVMKHVAAIAGDSVLVQTSGVIINGESIPNTRALSADSLARPVPHQSGIHRLRPGEFWLLSNQVSGSLDSRYFGPVTQILGVVEPFLTDRELCGIPFIHSYVNC